MNHMTRCTHCPKCFTPTTVAALAGHCSLSCIAMQIMRREQRGTIIQIRREVEIAARAGRKT